jgi:recombinational DNA repair protein RecR
MSMVHPDFRKCSACDEVYHHASAHKCSERDDARIAVLEERVDDLTQRLSLLERREP